HLTGALLLHLLTGTKLMKNIALLGQRSAQQQRFRSRRCTRVRQLRRRRGRTLLAVAASMRRQAQPAKNTTHPWLLVRQPFSPDVALLALSTDCLALSCVAIRPAVAS